MTGEDFTDRLRRLRREPKAAPQAQLVTPSVAPPTTPVEARPQPVRADSALAQHTIRKQLAQRQQRNRRVVADAPSLAPSALGPPSGLEPSSTQAASLRARTSVFERAHAHGAWRLEEIANVDVSVFTLLTRDAALAGLDLERALFLDTETTGLSGGAGTYVFLVGLGRFERGRFHVWQGFLSEPAHERELLCETAARIADAPAIVSFFGKSFDRHRLEDKMRMHRIEPPFAGKPHLDLYHPLRSLYRGAFDDGRLRTLEHALCGVEREDDLPGSFAPAAWFDFLAGRAHQLEGVFRHNLDDVLSLVTLAAHLGSVLRETRGAGEALTGCAATRADNLARACARSGDKQTALRWIERALDGCDRVSARARGALMLRAELRAALGASDEALEAFMRLAETEDHLSARCLLAAAKLEEHARRDIDAALQACTRAAGVIERVHTGAERARLVRELEARRIRLTGKLERTRRA